MIEIQKDDFMNLSGLCVIDFFATWCNPCKVVANTLDSLEKEFEGDVFFGKMDIENCRDLVESLKIRGVPTVLVMKDGVEVERLVGLLDKDKYKEAINKLR